MVDFLSEVDAFEEDFVRARVVLVLLDRGIFFVVADVEVVDVEVEGRTLPRSAAGVERPFA